MIIIKSFAEFFLQEFNLSANCRGVRDKNVLYCKDNYLFEGVAIG